MAKMSLRPFWHSTVDMYDIHYSAQADCACLTVEILCQEKPSFVPGIMAA